MHIIAGRHKGRKLFYHQQSGLRPTSARVKEALFNILGPAIVQESFLDIFAGCGSVGLEALSRGADLVAFVEKNGANCKLIARNLELLNETAQVCHASFENALQLLERQERTFAYIYLDPGYSSDHAKSCLRFLGSSSIIQGNTIVVAEHSRREPPPQVIGCLAAYRQAVYGDTALTFYQPTQATDSA